MKKSLIVYNICDNKKKTEYTDMIRYGILSTATIIPRFVKGIRESGKGEVVAVASRNVEKAKAAAEKLSIEKYYGTYEELYADPDVDAIYIATINSAHYQNTKDALNAGKHVICEKPLVLEEKQADELFELAASKNLFLVEAQKEVFLPVTNKARKYIENGVIGDVRILDFATSFPAETNDWLFDLSKGGGVMWTNAVYCIEYIEYLMQKDITDFDGMRLVDEKFGGDEICALTFKLGNDTIVTSRISGRVKTINQLLIYGTEGYIVIPDFYKADRMTVHYHDDREDEEFTFPTSSEMKYEAAHFSECIENGELTSSVITRDITTHSVIVQEVIQNKWLGK